jgi:hypothetical protein
MGVVCTPIGGQKIFFGTRDLDNRFLVSENPRVEKLFFLQRKSCYLDHKQQLVAARLLSLRLLKIDLMCSVMVWAAICATGKTSLVFVEKGNDRSILLHEQCRRVF